MKQNNDLNEPKKYILKGNKKIILDDQGRVRKVVTVNSMPSKTEQQFKEDCNVNSIIAKYRRTGQINHLKQNSGVYMDLTSIPDYEGALNAVIKADSTFSTLSADVRKEFDNDPRKLISFLNDPSNKDRAIELGLILPDPKSTQAINSDRPEKPSTAPKQADPSSSTPAQ